MTNPIKFPARDKAMEEIKKIDQSFGTITGSLSKLKEFELKRTGVLTMVDLGNIKKQIEKCQSDFECYKKENYKPSQLRQSESPEE